MVDSIADSMDLSVENTVEHSTEDLTAAAASQTAAVSMEELVRFIAVNLVDKPEEVKITARQGERSVILELSVAPEDMGKVIGKQGRIAKAIRRVLKAASVKQNENYVLEII